MLSAFQGITKSTISNTRRILAQYSSGRSGPLVIVSGGIHGNEPSGIFAIRSVEHKLRVHAPNVAGTFVGICGNLQASRKHQRYITEDLNRCFTDERIKKVQMREPTSEEEEELIEVISTLTLLTSETNPDDVYFIDCHSTSSRTIPYVSVNNHVESIQLARELPVHTVVGLERSIPGCFAEFCNQRGYRGFTFEAGQHETLSTIEHQEAAIWQMLVSSGFMSKEDVPYHDHWYNLLSEVTGEKRHFYELLEHYRIAPGETFTMKPGFDNFAPVKQGDELATSNGETIVAHQDGNILMPLYQKQGNDGYFLLKDMGT